MLAAPPETEAPVKDLAQEIIDREKRFVFQNYGRYPLALHRGKGCNLFDFSGRRYLDLISGIGVNGLGHAHPRIVRVIREQVTQLVHCSNLYYQEYQGLLAERLARMSGLQRSFFCNSGAEGIETAVKMIRSHGNRIDPAKNEIITCENSFHGRTTGAISITGQPKYRKDFEPLLAGVRFIPFNDPAALEAAMNERTAGVVLEVIQGEGGVFPVSEVMLRTARELCDRYNALLVFDEIQCGVGRTGTYFAYQMFDPPVLPDVVVTAKPIAAGLPLGAVIASESAAATIAPGMHGTTFGGGVLSCRVACEFLDILDEILPQMRERSAYFEKKLQALAARHAVIREVRVRGLMIGVELHVPGKQCVSDAMNLGLLINCTHETVLRFLPPYIISEKEIDKAVRILDKVLKAVPSAPASPAS
ncbi:MAG: aspartate aminotransferase family protein [Bryobacteraceae bacterium]